EAGIRVSASFPAVAERTHWDWGSSNPALPMRGLTRSDSRSLDARPYAASPTCCFPPVPFGGGRWDVLSAFFQRSRDSPDKTRQTLTTAHTSVDHSEADWRKCGSCGGGADRSALRKGVTWRSARNCSVSGLVLTRAPVLY